MSDERCSFPNCQNQPTGRVGAYPFCNEVEHVEYAMSALSERINEIKRRAAEAGLA